MVGARGKGRNLELINFAKEIFLTFAFSKKYEGQQEMNEEKMAELFGIMSSDPGQFKKLPQPLKLK